MKEHSDYEKEKTVNDLQREVFIHKTLCELQVDLMVCKLLKEFNKKALPISDANEHKMSEIDMLFARYGINKK